MSSAEASLPEDSNQFWTLTRALRVILDEIGRIRRTHVWCDGSPSYVS